MNHHPVVWFEIYVQDMARARTFYESVFQVQLQSLSSPNLEMWSFPMNAGQTNVQAGAEQAGAVQAGAVQAGAGGALVKMAGVASGGNSTLVYFSCADCAVEAARVVAAGGQLQSEKMAIGEYGFIALATDTEGNMIGLHSMQ